MPDPLIILYAVYVILIPIFLIFAIGVGNTIGNYIRRSNAIASAQLLCALSTEISGCTSIHQSMSADPTWPPANDTAAQAAIIGYVAIFQKLGIALDNNVLLLEDVDRLFALQFFTMTSSQFVKRLILDDEASAPYYQGILELHGIWFERRKAAGLPIPREADQVFGEEAAEEFEAVGEDD